MSWFGKGWNNKVDWHPASGKWGWFGQTQASRVAEKSRKQIADLTPEIEARRGKTEKLYGQMGKLNQAGKEIADLTALESFLSSSYDIGRVSDEKRAHTGLASVRDEPSEQRKKSMQAQARLAQQNRDLNFQKQGLNLDMQKAKDLYAIDDLLRTLEMENITYGG